MDYSQGKIYRLVSGGLVYYGSTIETLSNRLSKHKYKWKNTNNGTTSRLLYENNSDVLIELVEEYPCENKKELEKRERWWIENNECVNKIIPTRTMSEWREKSRHNRLKQMKEYYEKNKEQHKQYRKQQYEKNKETINEKLKEKLVCDCGAIIRVSGLPRHKKTKKHLDYIKKYIQ